jgi:hypothetical protein
LSASSVCVCLPGPFASRAYFLGQEVDQLKEGLDLSLRSVCTSSGCPDPDLHWIRPTTGSLIRTSESPRVSPDAADVSILAGDRGHPAGVRDHPISP